MKLTNQLLNCLRISTDAANGSVRDHVEITWPVKTSNQISEEITYLDDGYVLPQPSCHFKALQTFSTRSRDEECTNDDVETISFPVEANVIVVSQTPRLNAAVSETIGDPDKTDIQTSHDIIPESPLTFEMTKTKPSSIIKKIMRAVKYLLRRKVQTTRVTVCNSNAAPVCQALQRLRSRRAMYYD